MQVDETTALAVAIASLKKRKRYPDPITLAQSVKYLVELYGSQQKVADILDVSDSTIQIWTKIAELPAEFQEYIRDDRIKPVAAYNIASRLQDREEQLEVARAVLGWPENEIVRVLKYKRQNPKLSIEECKQKVIAESLSYLIR